MAKMCPIHNMEFFKRGSMRGFAHPIGEKDEATGKYPKGWCNEEDLDSYHPVDPDKEIARETTAEPPTKSKDKQIAEHVWWKIAAGWVGNVELMDYIEKTFPSGKAFRKTITLAAITQMLATLPIKVEDK